MMEKRRKIGLDMNVLEIITLMSEGNPGAINALAEVIKKSPMNVIAILDLDDMNMRGSQIWVGYKDYCKQDVDKFIEACRSRDKGMVAIVNRECPDRVATTGGASFDK